MRVLMLGWEFPPYISGGLGTACLGLTRALSRRQAKVTFVLPRPFESHDLPQIELVTPGVSLVSHGHAASSRHGAGVGEVIDVGLKGLKDVTFHAVPSRMASPYQSAGGQLHHQTNAVQPHDQPLSILQGPGTSSGPASGQYSGDMLAESQRYADLCLRVAAGTTFEVIHAHDWMTFPAGLAVAAKTGKPLVVHVHSTEFDRSGEHMNATVYDIERRGMLGAIRVIAVSHFTRDIIIRKYGIDAPRIDVVYNGIEIDETQPVPVRRSGGRHSERPVAGAAANAQAVEAQDDADDLDVDGHGDDVVRESPSRAIRKQDKIVLFLGRITMQKGPEYFVNAAKKVLEKMDNVKFIMAGTGDKVRDVIELAAEQGIGHKVLFTGFLRGADVDRIYDMADVYVMPSVSEPFGIAPLEAIRHDVPVIISRTSGVSEVLHHVLKVDFWDTHDMADKIIAVLKHPPLGRTLRQHADIEVRRLTWDDAARNCERVYENATNLMPV